MKPRVPTHKAVKLQSFSRRLCFMVYKKHKKTNRTDTKIYNN